MKCEQKKNNGEQCKNPSLNGEKFCYWHSEKISEVEKHENRSKCGRSKIIKVNGNQPEYNLTSIKNIIKLNSLMINKVLRNKEDLRVCTGLGYLLNLQMKLIETNELEKRLERVEGKLPTNIIVKLPEAFENNNDN